MKSSINLLTLAILPGLATAALAFTAIPAGYGSDGPSNPEMDRPSVNNQTVQNLISNHECWTGQVPIKYANIIPGHAVVLDNNPSNPAPFDAASRIEYTGSRTALDQVFNHNQHGLVIYAFCL